MTGVAKKDLCAQKGDTLSPTEPGVCVVVWWILTFGWMYGVGAWQASRIDLPISSRTLLQDIQQYVPLDFQASSELSGPPIMRRRDHGRRAEQSRCSKLGTRPFFHGQEGTILPRHILGGTGSNYRSFNMALPKPFGPPVGQNVVDSCLAIRQYHSFGLRAPKRSKLEAD